MTDPNTTLSHLDLADLATHEKTYLDANELVINMGPQHPATHGVLRVILRLDGEKVLGLECVIGYLHRGVEKIGEHRTYTMFNPYVDRMDYVAAVSNGLGYCETVEKLLGVEAPPRAQHVRVILTELLRRCSTRSATGKRFLRSTKSIAGRGLPRTPSASGGCNTKRMPASRKK
jgi:NADH:ubiquinone oxidoreductase subunit D